MSAATFAVEANPEVVADPLPDASMAATSAEGPVPASDAPPATVVATDAAVAGDASPQADAGSVVSADADADAAAAPAPVQPLGATTIATTVQPAAEPFAAPAGDAGSVGGAVLALLLVVGLILALAWLARRMPGIGAGASNPALRVVGSLALGPRERLVVVEVGQTQLLLGVGNGGTRTLHTLEAPLPEAAASTSPFAQVLAQHFGKKP